LAHFYSNEIADVEVSWQQSYLDSTPLLTAYTVAVNSSHTRGTGDAPLEVSWGGFTIAVALRVYAPSPSVILEMDDDILNSIQHATSPSCDGCVICFES
jgi:hypothetical protein